MTFQTGQKIWDGGSTKDHENYKVTKLVNIVYKNRSKKGVSKWKIYRFTKGNLNLNLLDGHFSCNTLQYLIPSQREGVTVLHTYPKTSDYCLHGPAIQYLIVMTCNKQFPAI